MKKRIITGLLTIAMVSSLAMSVSAADTTSTITPGDTAGNGTGNATVEIVGETIPEPVYTVTIPEKIAFEQAIVKKMKNATDKIAKTKDAEVSVAYQNLFANEKKVTVTLNSDFTVKLTNDAATTMTYQLYDKADDTRIQNAAQIFNLIPIKDEENQSQSKSMYATIDQSKIKVAGEYEGTVTFDVALADR